MLLRSMSWKISTINSHNKCKSIIHGCSLFKLSSVCQFGECCDGLPTTESIIEIDNSFGASQFSPEMRHLVSKRWVVRKTCLSGPVVIPPKYSCLYLSLLRLYPSRLKEQTGNLKHHLLCSLMITLGDRSTTFSSLGGLVIQPSCRQLTDFLCPTAMCAGRFRSALLKC